MYRIPRPHPWPPTIDLTTVRETMLYMHDDMRRVPGLEKAARAMNDAIKEIDLAERTMQREQNLSPIAAKFMPSRIF
ncbi:MAG: hypothetical protein ACRBCJ_06775 [Hyphomicrobiaceae bacterium]